MSHLLTFAIRRIAVDDLIDYIENLVGNNRENNDGKCPLNVNVKIQRNHRSDEAFQFQAQARRSFVETNEKQG
jgi:hypothetical protein